jgi:hypothetical protein
LSRWPSWRRRGPDYELELSAIRCSRVAESFPPCSSMILLQIDSPIPFGTRT